MAKFYSSSAGIFILLSSLIGLNVEAAQEPSIKLLDDQFSEQYSTNVPVSGRVLAGIAINSDILPGLSIFIPHTNDNEQICMRVLSRDGTYSSLNQYQVPNNLKEGFQSVEYPSEFMDVISSFSESDLAVLAYSGQCKDNPVNELYLSARGEPKNSDKVTIFVSSGRSEVFLRIPNENSTTDMIRCKRIQQGKRTGYDTQCHIGLSKLLTGKNEISLIRRKSGRMLPSVKFSILYSRSIS